MLRSARVESDSHPNSQGRLRHPDGIALADSNGVLSISGDVATSAQGVSDFYASNPNTNIFTIGPTQR